MDELTNLRWNLTSPNLTRLVSLQGEKNRIINILSNTAVDLTDIDSYVTFIYPYISGNNIEAKYNINSFRNAYDIINAVETFMDRLITEEEIIRIGRIPIYISATTQQPVYDPYINMLLSFMREQGQTSIKLRHLLSTTNTSDIYFTGLQYVSQGNYLVKIEFVDQEDQFNSFSLN